MKFLTLFFPIFPLDPPENIRKTLEKLWFPNIFRGIKREYREKKHWQKYALSFVYNFVGIL